MELHGGTCVAEQGGKSSWSSEEERAIQVDEEEKKKWCRLSKATATTEERDKGAGSRESAGTDFVSAINQVKKKTVVLWGRREPGGENGETSTGNDRWKGKEGTLFVHLSDKLKRN